MQEHLQQLRIEIERYYPGFSVEEWQALYPQLIPVTYKKGATIFSETVVCKHILFVTKGVAAAEYQASNDRIITRFFTPQSLCSNIVSLLSNELGDDQVFATTEVHGVLIPKDLFLEPYLYGGGLGIYLRKKILQVILEDKHYLSMKTIPGVRAKLTFLQEQHPEILLETPWKYIANFMGVTPAWLSRVLKKSS